MELLGWGIITVKIYGVTRSEIMTRAWTIRHREQYRKFGTCLSMAWDEARDGRLVNWHHLPMEARFPMPEERIEDLKREMFMLEMQDNWGVVGLERMRSLRQEVSQLERMVAA